MLEKSIYLLTEYQIFEFPIPIYIIDQIIRDQNIKITILKNLNRTCLIDNEIITCNYSCCHDYRTSIVHEAGHAFYHSSNYFNNDYFVNSKNEAQANAFAAYFLMPIYVFEEAMKYTENDFELSEEFGVTVEFVQFRKKLTESLLLDGYFKEEVLVEKNIV